MNQETILLPALTLVGLTFFVFLWMANLRFTAVKKGDLNAEYFKTNQGAEPPEYLKKVSRNFLNLLEIPILFYVLIIMIFVTQRVDSTYVAIAWIYVIARCIHTAIHTTYNNVFHRMIPFTLSVVLLIAMWLRLVVNLALS